MRSVSRELPNMTITNQNEVKLQKIYILGTGHIANFSQLTEYNDMLAHDNGIELVDLAINSHID
jgi:hypothetical protein